MFSIIHRGLGRGRRLLRRLLLVALLLLLFGTIANGQEEQKVGAGQHTLKDGKVHLAPGWNDEGKVNSDCDVKQVKHVSGKTKIIVSRTNPNKGCTVDLVTSDVGNEFEFLAVLEPEEEDKTLEDCLTSTPYENSLQFNYGKTNKELEQFEKEPFNNEKGECPDKAQCWINWEKCMDATSLEMLWSKDKDYAFYLIPIGEPKMLSKSPINVKDWGAAMNVKILKNQADTGGAYEIKKFQTETPIVKSKDAPDPVCIDKEKAVPPPRFWPIADVKDKKDGKTPMRLLVFHLLPLAASRLTNTQPPPPPKCQLSIEFSKDKYPLLSKEVVEAPDDTTTQKPFTEPTQQPSGTAEQGEEQGELTTLKLFLMIGAVFLLLAAAGFLVWFLTCHGIKDEDADTSGEEEEAEEGTGKKNKARRSRSKEKNTAGGNDQR